MNLPDRLPVSGLGLRPRHRPQAVNAIFASILGVTLFIIALDLTLRPPPSYVAFFSSPLMPRMALTCFRAAIEEVEFRLLLMTSIVALLTMWRGRLSARWIVAAILLSQFANVSAVVIADPVYASLRYWLVGSVWGWLYWRHGWLAG